MKLLRNTQLWEGTFSYSESYNETDTYTTVDFKMELTFTEDSFTGTSTDSESEAAFNHQPAKIKGFIDDEKISFVKYYPCAYYKDDDGKIVLDNENAHPEIHYLGYWEGNRRSVSGIWEMKIYEERYEDDFLEELLIGEFEMRRVK